MCLYGIFIPYFFNSLKIHHLISLANPTGIFFAGLEKKNHFKIIQ